MMSLVKVYATGLLNCSACAPAYMPAEDVQREVNRIHECGTEKGWTISQADKFASGLPMPCPCDVDAGRRHWLLDA